MCGASWNRLWVTRLPTPSTCTPGLQMGFQRPNRKRWQLSTYRPAGVRVRRSPPDIETPPSARLYKSQPTTPLSRPLRLTAHPPVLRITQPTTRVLVPPAIVTAVPRQVSSVMPRSVTNETSFMVTRFGSTEIIGLPVAIGRGRPEVEDARLPVQVPFARLVEFGQQVVGVVPLALAEAEGVLRLGLERDDPLLRVDRLDLQPLVGPVPEPVAVEHDVLGAAPALGPVAVVGEDPLPAALGAADVHRRRAEQVDDLDEALVRPAGQGHGLVLEEQFEPRLRLAPGRTGLHLAQVRDALGLEVGLQHVAARRFVQSCQHRRIGDRLPARHDLAADQTDFGSLARPVDDRRLLGPRVLLDEFQRPGQLVDAAGQFHRDAALGQRTGLLELADCVAGPLERGERTVAARVVRRRQTARPSIVAVGGDEQRDGFFRRASLASVAASPTRPDREYASLIGLGLLTAVFVQRLAATVG